MSFLFLPSSSFSALSAPECDLVEHSLGLLFPLPLAVLFFEDSGFFTPTASGLQSFKLETTTGNIDFKWKSHLPQHFRVGRLEADADESGDKSGLREDSSAEPEPS